MPNKLLRLVPDLLLVEKRVDIPSKEVIMPLQGLSSGGFGLRMRNPERGGKRGGASLECAPVGLLAGDGMLIRQ